MNKPPEPWVTLARRLGGYTKLAQALGVSRRYLYFWMLGQRIPSKTAQLAIAALFKDYGMPTPTYGPSSPSPRFLLPNFRILESTPERILLQDIGPWDDAPTITNAAEAVVELIAPDLEGRRLEYLDSEGERCELLVVDGKFAGFKPIWGDEK